jgi:hypothetical protein
LGSPFQSVTIDGVDVSVAEIANIPPGKVRIPRLSLWCCGGRRGGFTASRCGGGVADRYGAGVETCRWLANAVVTPRSGPWSLAPSPVTKDVDVAYEEAIEAECLVPELEHRPGWVGTVVMLKWVWWRYGSPPLEFR